MQFFELLYLVYSSQSPEEATFSIYRMVEVAVVVVDTAKEATEVEAVLGIV